MFLVFGTKLRDTEFMDSSRRSALNTGTPTPCRQRKLDH